MLRTAAHHFQALCPLGVLLLSFQGCQGNTWIFAYIDQLQLPNPSCSRGSLPAAGKSLFKPRTLFLG